MDITLIVDLHYHKLTLSDYNIIQRNAKDTILLQVSGEISDDILASGPCIVLTDSDQAILHWQDYKLPVLAWSHLANVSQSLMKASWLILDPDAISQEYLEEIYCHSHGIPMVICETRRCLLRELCLGDLEDLLSLDGEQEADSAGRFFPHRDAGATFSAEEYLTSYIKNQYSFYGFGIYGAFDREFGEFLGIAGFSATEDGLLEIGYAVKKGARQKGYAKEWISQLVKYAADKLEVDRVIARIPRHNIASIKAASSCGVEILTP